MGRLTGDVLMLEILERYSWTYQDYMEQPTWVIDLIHKKMGIEAKLAAAKQ